MSEFPYIEDKDEFTEITKTLDLFYLPSDVTLRKYGKEIFLDFNSKFINKINKEEPTEFLYFKNSDEETELKYTKLELHYGEKQGDESIKYTDLENKNDLQNKFREDDSSLSNIYIIKEKDGKTGIYECVFYPVMLHYLLKPDDLDELKKSSNNISQLSHKFLSYYLDDDISTYKGFSSQESTSTNN